MTDAERVAAWMDAYVGAWQSNEPEQIGVLFADGATYRTEPDAAPWRGREAIVRGWLDRQDPMGSTRFTWSLVAVDGDLAVVQGLSIYLDRNQTYDNLWLVRLDEHGAATEFTEWWMLRTTETG